MRVTTKTNVKADATVAVHRIDAGMLDPVAVSIDGYGYRVSAYLTPDQAREVAAALDRVASAVQP